MNVDDLKRKGALYFDNIQQGFDQYKYEVIKMTASQAKNRFLHLWKACDKEDGYVDFYYYRLQLEEQRKVDTVLEEEEIAYLHSRNYEEDIIYPLDETLLSIVTKCNESEMLFSTIYFTNPAITYWGNYGHEYVVFDSNQIRGG